MSVKSLDKDTLIYFVDKINTLLFQMYQNDRDSWRFRQKRWNRHLKSLDTFHQIVWNNHFNPYIIHGDSCKKMECGHLKSLDTFHQIVWNNHFKPYIIHGDSCKKMESASEISRYISSKLCGIITLNHISFMEIHAKRWNGHLKSLDTFHQIFFHKNSCNWTFMQKDGIGHFQPYISQQKIKNIKKIFLQYVWII